MTIKTASEINKFQEEKEFRPGFQKVYEVVCTMPICQREQSIEPYVSKESMEEEPEGKEESESENDGLSISTPMESTLKGSEKKRKIILCQKSKQKRNKCLREYCIAFLTTSGGIFKREWQATERRHEMSMAIMQRFIMGAFSTNVGAAF